jgi:ATP-dependent DNA helicase RecG
MSSIRPGHPWLAKDDLGLLKKLEAYRVDRQSKQEGLTLAGVLMFGKMEAIHDPECAPQFFPDYREVLTQDPEVRWTDRIYPDGTWEANLFQFYLQVWPRISAGLPRPFQLKNGQRQDDTPAHIALREAFINSLVHADYNAPSSLVSIRKTKGFQFTNPGTLLVSVRQYYEGGVSVCRNKALQKMFSLIGGAEQAGSGADKIVRGWEVAHWQRPYLEVQDQPDLVTLELTMESILSGQAQERLNEAFGERATTLFGERLTVLSIVAMEESVTHRSLRYRVGMHAADLSGLLKSLCLDGFLVSKGWGSGTTYQLNDGKAGQALSALEKTERSSPNMGEVLEKVGSSSKKVGSSIEKVGSSIEKVGSSNEKVGSSSSQKYLESISLKLQKALFAAAADGWHTPAELAEATSKSINYLKVKIIPVLVAAKLLERKYDEVTHPNQAYRTVKS